MAVEKQWVMSLGDEFEAEFEELPEDVKDALLTCARAVELAGPKAGRPHVDTLNDSKHSNMKELRFKSGDASQIWRAAFAFDPEQKGIILAAGSKQGVSERRFYKALIAKADKRFDRHLQKLKRKQGGQKVKE